jgi:hypothetical protein
MPPKSELTSDQRKQVVSHLLSLLKDGNQPPKLKRVANNFDVNWCLSCKSLQEQGAFHASPCKNKCGAKQKWNRDEVREALLLVPTHRKRRTLRKLDSDIGIPLVTLHWMKQDKHDNVLLVAHSNAIRPHLQEHRQFVRVLYSIANLNIEIGDYHDYFDSVHVDRKWFFLTEQQLNLYIVPGEPVPEKSVGHKSQILKVMFLAAIARPCYNDTGDCTFDGKIGIWPFVERVPAPREVWSIVLLVPSRQSQLMSQHINIESS